MIAIIEKFYQGTASILEWLSHSLLVEMEKFFDKTFVSSKNWMIGIIKKCLQGTVSAFEFTPTLLVNKKLWSYHKVALDFLMGWNLAKS